ncbi:MAG: polysaccharide deacetylase family protein [Clostridia bacterium]|nr:polysaccharide deacetylase family protein [Clostridia bacterium]
MKRITAILLISIIITGVFSLSASALSYEEYKNRYKSNTTSSNPYSKYYDYYGMLSANKYVESKIPAIMYHKVTHNPDEVTDYVVTAQMVRDDFEEIKARGYTPIFVSEYYDLVNIYKSNDKNRYNKIVEYFEETSKPIIITFDDGYEGIYEDVLPLMKEYGFKVNFYICGELIDQQNPEYCTWEEVKELSQCGLAEIGNHTYGLHKYSKDVLADMYNYNLYSAIFDINQNRALIKEKLGLESNIISFPYGLYDSYVLDVLKTYGYDTFISTDYRVNTIKDAVATLGRFNRPASFTTKEFFDLIENYR